MPKFVYNSLFQFGKDDTKYDLVSKKGVSERKQGVGVGLGLLRTHRLLKNVFEEIGAVHFRFLVLSD